MSCHVNNIFVLFVHMLLLVVGMTFVSECLIFYYVHMCSMVWYVHIQ